MSAHYISTIRGAIVIARHHARVDPLFPVAAVAREADLRRTRCVGVRPDATVCDCAIVEASYIRFMCIALTCFSYRFFVACVSCVCCMRKLPYRLCDRARVRMPPHTTV